MVLTLLALAATGAAAAPAPPRRPSTPSSPASSQAQAAASGGYALDTTTGRTLAAVRADTPRIPASVNKLYTTSTALLRFGAAGDANDDCPRRRGLDDKGTLERRPLPARRRRPDVRHRHASRSAPTALGASVTTLAQRLAASASSRHRRRLRRRSCFDRLRGGPTSGFALDYDLGGPLGGLIFNRGLAKEEGSALQTSRRSSPAPAR